MAKSYKAPSCEILGASSSGGAPDGAVFYAVDYVEFYQWYTHYQFEVYMYYEHVWFFDANKNTILYQHMEPV